MESSLSVLIVTAITLAFFHTAVGPDHYLPFIVLGRSEGWSLRRLWLWTFLCGLGHVLSSVVVGALGIAVGWTLHGMEWFEGSRGNLASWGLMIFGALYILYGVIQARRGHVHRHVHGDGTIHAHVHGHTGHDEEGEPFHADRKHDATGHLKAHRRTLWALFIIFVLGPCEPLIPLLMVPASSHSVGGIALVATVFSVVTIATMMVIATLGHLGLGFIKLGALERYIHVLSGTAIFLSGAAMVFLGL